MDAPYDRSCASHLQLQAFQDEQSYDWGGEGGASSHVAATGYHPASHYFNSYNENFLSPPAYLGPTSTLPFARSLDGRDDGMSFTNDTPNISSNPHRPHDPPTTDIFVARLFNPQLGNPGLVQCLFQELMLQNYELGPHTHSSENLEPEAMCPASSSQLPCSCSAMTRQNLLDLPYKPNLSAKPTRALRYRCRLSIIEHFPPEERTTILKILSDPLQYADTLSDLVVCHKDEVSENKFGCLCCPFARFQATQKVTKHLLGLFDIRREPCQYCSKLSIDSDDKKKHEKRCPKNPNANPP